MKRTTVTQALRSASRPLRSSRLVTRWLFGADVPHRIHDDLWDMTTLVLKKALRRSVRDGDRVLELGTGHVGVLSIYCAKHRHVELVAVDVSAEFVANASAVARASRAPHIAFRTSNWCSSVEGRFDVVFSNLPYVPTAAGVAWGATTAHPQIWDGGADGCEPARVVLAQVGPHLSPGGRLLLGVNRVYVGREKMASVLAAYPDWQLERVVTSRLSPGEVYVLKRVSGS